ncbi:MAG: succinylglutamate desuccinylase/aspartoacylase family protein [Gemmatimonadetes bacterium]|nr:succinylglutamate desuccinylase/aspartoacylase family protein [Gemmatimonadota bacterium]
MALKAEDILTASTEVERVLGRVTGKHPGATLLCIGGLHGNEPAGVRAARRVADALVPRSGELRGEFVALSGNRAALAAGKRFLTRDLNRAWTEKRLERFRTEGRLDGGAEDREQEELLAAIEDVVRRARGAVYLLDLHTTSAHGGPFTNFGDTLPNRALAEHIPVPMILGLEELVEGTLVAYLGRHGVVGVTYESGQHEEPRAVDRAEAGIWLAVEAVGLLPEGRVPEAVAGRKLLQGETDGLPRVLEMYYRHSVGPADAFLMRPGYRNFQPVRRKQVVAEDRRGDVRVPRGSRDGRVLMPLYQTQGEDGFFLMREFRPFWLWVSYLLRSLGADRVVGWLPGVRRNPRHPDAVLVDRRIARWYAVELFHLLGYRIQEDHGARLVMRRRRFDEARLVERGPTPEGLR